MTSDGRQPVGSSVNGSGFKPFDMVIPFAFKKGEITGEMLGVEAEPLGICYILVIFICLLAVIPVFLSPR